MYLSYILQKIKKLQKHYFPDFFHMGKNSPCPPRSLNGESRRDLRLGVAVVALGAGDSYWLEKKV